MGDQATDRKDEGVGQADPVIDPTCTMHGLKRSEHQCLYCCLCFKDLTPDECHVLPDGAKEDVCNECAEMEAKAMKPNPGSDEAIHWGCICAVLDNAHGRGYMGQPGTFVYTQGCPVHDEEGAQDT